MHAAEGADDSVKTGAFAMLATPAEIFGPDSAANFASIIPVDEAISWQITVPASYDPENPPGLLVYISPSNSGDLPRKWNGLPESHNLIWIAENESGNRIEVARRITFTLFAVALINARYSIDSKRIYLSGFSGGARVAGLAAAAYPQVFKGQIYVGGAEFWDSEPAPARLEAMKQNRYVFLWVRKTAIVASRVRSLPSTKLPESRMSSLGLFQKSAISCRGTSIWPTRWITWIAATASKHLSRAKKSTRKRVLFCLA